MIRACMVDYRSAQVSSVPLQRDTGGAALMVTCSAARQARLAIAGIGLLHRRISITSPALTVNRSTPYNSFGAPKALDATFRARLLPSGRVKRS